MNLENRYVCDVPNCNKSFSRPDHLGRHQLNHKSAQKHKCPWPNCGKTFIRNDVCKKHYKQQHEKKVDTTKKVKKSQKLNNIRFIMMDSSKVTTNPANTKEVQEDICRDITLETPNFESEQRQDEIVPQNSSGLSVDDLVSSDELIRWIFGDINANSASDVSSNKGLVSISPNENLENYPELEEFEYPFSNMNTKNNVDELTQDSFLRLKLVSLDNGQILNFPFSTQKVLMNQQIMESLADIIPSIKFQEEFKADRLQYYLECYWKYYHPQFPILNMPSFSTSKCHPILLLALLCIGSYMSATFGYGGPNRIVIFSKSIAVPLRWAIYNSKDFKPPPRLWVVQSLLLLETYEICCSSRELHERANLHRGISIQMLKRSPMFGGNPWHKYMNGSNDASGNNNFHFTSIPPYASREHWENWISEESMKRCALATFYLETLHAVVFGHDMSVDLHTVKPTLPCDEEFWRTGKYSDNCSETPLTLLTAIKSILTKKPVKIRGFGKKIILSGLIALSFEVRNREFELSIPELKSVKQLWQRKINEAFNFWDLNCSVSNQKNPINWSDTYSIPLRELYESYTQMRHYDFMVYAGAPGRMNVEFNEKETELVCARIGEWSNSLHGKRAVIFIYSYFCNSLSRNVNQEESFYNPNYDKCLYRKQVISHMLIILWCYNFYMCGTESDSYKWNPENPDQIPCKEDAMVYLERIEKDLSMLAGKPFTNESLYEDIDVFAGVLDSVSKKQNIVGFLRSFKREYSKDLSEIAREHSRLLENCINRSLGSNKVFCSNMFE